MISIHYDEMEGDMSSLQSYMRVYKFIESRARLPINCSKVDCIHKGNINIDHILPQVLTCRAMATHHS